MWKRVQTAFAQELEPDDPAKLGPHQAAYKYKYLQQIGVFQDEALVIVRHRLIESDPYDDWFTSYSYDLRSGIKRDISPDSDALYGFNVVKLAQFDRSLAPDIVFTYDSCSECEPEHFIASVRYDSENHRWEVRQWENKNNLLLAEDPTPDENLPPVDYAINIRDWNGDGLDDVAIVRRSKGHEDSIMLYKAENGRLVGHWMIDSNERAIVNAQLCPDSNFSFCPQHK